MLPVPFGEDNGKPQLVYHKLGPRFKRTQFTNTDLRAVPGVSARRIKSGLVAPNFLKRLMTLC